MMFYWKTLHFCCLTSNSWCFIPFKSMIVTSWWLFNPILVNAQCSSHVHDIQSIDIPFMVAPMYHLHGTQGTQGTQGSQGSRGACANFTTPRVRAAVQCFKSSKGFSLTWNDHLDRPVLNNTWTFVAWKWLKAPKLKGGFKHFNISQHITTLYSYSKKQWISLMNNGFNLMDQLINGLVAQTTQCTVWFYMKHAVQTMNLIYLLYPHFKSPWWLTALYDPFKDG